MTDRNTLPRRSFLGAAFGGVLAVLAKPARAMGWRRKAVVVSAPAVPPALLPIKLVGGPMQLKPSGCCIIAAGKTSSSRPRIGVPFLASWPVSKPLAEWETGPPPKFGFATFRNTGRIENGAVVFEYAGVEKATEAETREYEAAWAWGRARMVERGRVVA